MFKREEKLTYEECVCFTEEHVSIAITAYEVQKPSWEEGMLGNLSPCWFWQAFWIIPYTKPSLMGGEIHVHMNKHKHKHKHKAALSEQHPWAHHVPRGAGGMARKEAADGDIPHLFPSLHHREVPAMCSCCSAGPEGAHRTCSLQGERKHSAQQSLHPLNTLAQAVKYLRALEEASPMQTGCGQLKSSNLNFAFFNEKENTLLSLEL